MPTTLPDGVRRQLDSLSEDAKRAVHSHLGRALDTHRPARDDGADLHEQIIELLSRAGLHEDHINRVLELLNGAEAGSADAPSRDRHARDRRPADDGVVGIRKAYDDEEDRDAFGSFRRGGGRLAADDPPAFPGRPEVGGSMTPMRGEDDDIRAINEGMGRIRGEAVPEYRDGKPASDYTPGRGHHLIAKRPARDAHGFTRHAKPSVAQDAAAPRVKSFTEMFPDAGRIKVLG